MVSIPCTLSQIATTMQKKLISQKKMITKTDCVKPPAKRRDIKDAYLMIHVFDDN